MLVLVGMAMFVQDVPEECTSQMLEMRPVLIVQLVTPLRWRELTLRNNVVSKLTLSKSLEVNSCPYNYFLCPFHIFCDFSFQLLVLLGTQSLMACVSNVKQEL